MVREISVTGWDVMKLPPRVW